jgi:hypothetical protein
MKPKPLFDDELPPRPGRSWWLSRSIGTLMIVVAVSALVLAFVAERSRRLAAAKQPPSRPRPILTAARLRRQIPQTKRLLSQPRDPFLIMADASIDPKMVVAAPMGIDDAMVVNRGGQSPQLGLIAPRAGVPPIPPTRRGPIRIPGPRLGLGQTPRPR